MTAQPLIFKIASEPEEFEKIFKLNYETFVEEIPQHLANPDHSLIDKFHLENTYFICLIGGQLAGMLTVRDQRPFSLDFKLENLDSYLPPHQAKCEFRLLAVERNHRRSRVLAGLVIQMAEYCEQRAYDLALISGTTRQLKLYRHLGFVPFGPLVGNESAKFQPMYLTLDAYHKLKSTAKIFNS